MLKNSGTRRNGKPLLPPGTQETVLPEFGETPTGATTVWETDSPQPGRKGAGWP